METKWVKLNHEGVHKNTEQFYREMKSVVKGADTIPLAVGSVTCPWHINVGFSMLEAVLCTLCAVVSRI